MTAFDSLATQSLCRREALDIAEPCRWAGFGSS